MHNKLGEILMSCCIEIREKSNVLKLVLFFLTFFGNSRWLALGSFFEKKTFLHVNILSCVEFLVWSLHRAMYSCSNDGFSSTSCMSYCTREHLKVLHSFRLLVFVYKEGKSVRLRCVGHAKRFACTFVFSLRWNKFDTGTKYHVARMKGRGRKSEKE